MTDRVLRRPEVEARTGLSRSTIYALISQGRFPRPVKLSKRAVGWRAPDVVQWIESRTSAAGEETANLPVPPSDLIEPDRPEDQALDIAEHAAGAKPVRSCTADRAVRPAKRAKST